MCPEACCSVLRCQSDAHDGGIGCEVVQAAIIGIVQKPGDDEQLQRNPDHKAQGVGAASVAIDDANTADSLADCVAQQRLQKKRFDDEEQVRGEHEVRCKPPCDEGAQCPVDEKTCNPAEQRCN